MRREIFHQFCHTHPVKPGRSLVRSRHTDRQKTSISIIAYYNSLVKIRKNPIYFIEILFFNLIFVKIHKNAPDFFRQSLV